MKGNDLLNTKITMSMLAAMVIFKIIEVKGQNIVPTRVTVNHIDDAIP